jgi:hypothetical protein
LTRKCLHSNITKTSQKVHNFFASGISKGDALIRRRMMKIGKLVALSFFMGMTVALLAAIVF